MATNFSLNEYLTIDTTGSVGIGTNVPLSRLHVTGSNSTTFPTAVLKAGTAVQGSGVGIFDVQNSAGTSLLFVSGSGNIGIGTISPAYKLQVASGFIHPAAGYGVFQSDDHLYLTGGSAKGVILNYSGGTRGLFLDALGQVGIGSTTTISARLQVSGSSTTSMPTMVVREGVVSPTAAVGTFDVQNSAGTSLFFVSGSGNIGIGTASPAAKLHVGAGNTTGLIVTSPTAFVSSTGTTSLVVRDATNGIESFLYCGSSLVLAGAASNHPYHIRTNNQTRITITAAGDVGIGTTATNGNMLSVNGTTALTGSVLPGATSTYDLGSSGMKWRTVYATNLTGSLTQLTDGTSYLIGGTGINVATGSNGAITHSIRDSVVATISGSTFTGAVKFSGGLSGSLQTLTNGNPYLVAGTNISLVTGSAGEVTIAVLPTAGSITGTGTANYSAIFTDTSSIGNGLIYDDGTKVGIGTTTFTSRFFVSGSSTTTTPVAVIKAGTTVQGSGVGIFDVQNSGGTSLLFVSGSGGVGIGTNSFTGQLYVKGSSVASIPTMVVKEGVSATGGAGTFDVQNSAGTSLLFVSGSGNIGIGTTLPGAKIEAYGTDAGLTVHNYNNSRGGIYAFDTQRIALASTSVNDNLVFGYTSSPGTTVGFVESMRIRNSTGNIGIGGKYPLSRFEVTGSGATSATSTMNLLNSSNTSLLFVRDDGAVGIGTVTPAVSGINLKPLAYDSTYAYMGTMTPSGGAYISGFIAFGNTAGTKYVRMAYAGSATAANEVATIDFTGTNRLAIGAALYVNSTTGNWNVGIGGTNPLSRFEVTGSGATSATSTMNLLNSSNTSLLFVRDDGNVGIGSSSPGYKLTVGGTVYATALSGSLTKLTDGTSFLIAGSNITLTTGSSGAITIDASLAGGTIAGAGTSGYITKWTGLYTAGSSNIYDSGTAIGIGTTAFTGETAGSLLCVSSSLTGNAASGLTIGAQVFNTSVNSYKALTHLFMGSAGSTNEYLRITSAGNVGIGTTTADYKLTVAGTVHATAFSGSHTRLTDGTSFLIAGPNITISTGSSGAVTIQAAAAPSKASAYGTITGSLTMGRTTLGEYMWTQISSSAVNFLKTPTLTTSGGNVLVNSSFTFYSTDPFVQTSFTLARSADAGSTWTNLADSVAISNSSTTGRLLQSVAIGNVETNIIPVNMMYFDTSLAAGSYIYAAYYKGVSGSADLGNGGEIYSILAYEV